MTKPRHRVAIVALPGTFVLDLAVAAQAFGRRPSVFTKIRDEARAPYDVVVCSPAEVETSLGFTIGDVAPVSEILTADTVVVPGLEAPWAPQHPDVLAAIKQAAADGKRMVSLCAGAFVLGQAGVLDGRRVTTHWALADEFREAFPAVLLDEHAMYVDDGQVLSAGGMLASTDLCLHILRSDHGQSYANDVSRVLISPPHRVGGQAQYAREPQVRATGPLEPVMAWVLDNLPEPLSLERVARQAHLSPRTLERRFRAETGESLQSWIARQRVARARALLEDSALTVTEVAHATGFGSSESMRRHFRAQVGTSPQAYRAAFRAPVA
ncbi:transcriptional regulator GlxA family with amidase domain [Nocardioides thalensis]|uniref:Transcriptional regulator GlxA family with amidase domain n=1 Tax=Nocardioides thalensis TaxID=1914755 RepID=A0A853C5Z4_9ACTN|nr:helix-turn-helix domain-containing protein [Nocardioides thalensis]NYJ03490.1 transcriptional regulator GlxA family with amidase domain [Nocardioides thalensis]